MKMHIAFSSMQRKTSKGSLTTFWYSMNALRTYQELRPWSYAFRVYFSNYSRFIDNKYERQSQHYNMGNDILNARTNRQLFIPAKRLQMAKSTQKLRVEAIEQIFGKAQEMTLKKNSTVPCLISRSIVQEAVEENTFEENSSPPERETRAQTSTETDQIATSLLALQEQVRRLKQHLEQNTYNQQNYSPVKTEKNEMHLENDVNRSNTRHSRHYFRLKGCEPPEEEKEVSETIF